MDHRSKAEDEDWGPALEMSPQLEADRRSMIFRLARKRAVYFADVGDLSAQVGIDELPTRRESALAQAVQLALIVTRKLSVEEQPTLETPIAEQSTLVAVATVSLPACAESLALALIPTAGEKNATRWRFVLCRQSRVFALARKLAFWLAWSLFPGLQLLCGVCLLSLGRLCPSWHPLQSERTQEFAVLPGES